MKINFATEIKNTFTRTVQQMLAGTSEIDLRKTFPPATAAACQLVEEKIRICAASNGSTSDQPAHKSRAGE